MFPSRRQARTLARGLGWFSVALGLIELAGARPLARGLGLAQRPGVLRACGLRELATGAALLRGGRAAAPGLWARVGGDLIDLALLGAIAAPRGRRVRQAAMAALAAVTWLDCGGALALSRPKPRARADYRDRSGWPGPAEQMRGAARADFAAPRDMVTPPPLRAWTAPASAAPPRR